MTEWIDNKNPDKDGRYLVMYREYAQKDFPAYGHDVLFDHPIYECYQRIMKYCNGKWCLPVTLNDIIESKIHREVIAWKELDDDYNGDKYWHTWQITAYDKDHDYYKCLKTGAVKDLIDDFLKFDKLCRNDRLINNDISQPEPFDAVFIEPVNAKGNEPRYFIDDFSQLI